MNTPLTRLRPWLLLLLAPCLVAWQGSGRGSASFQAGPAGGDPSRAVVIAADAVARLGQGRTQIVVLLGLPAPRGDAVLSVGIGVDGPLTPAVALPHPLVDIAFTEYGGGGDTVFHSRAGRGTLAVRFSPSGSITLEADLSLVDASRSEVRALSALSVHMAPDTLAAAADEGEVAPAGASATGSSGGCEEDPYVDSEAHDNAWNVGSAPPDDSGGCDGSSTGDEYDTDTSDSSGCEGDDLESETESESEEDDSSESSACDGDANAAGRFRPAGAPVRPRATRPLVAKLVSWLPFLAVLVPLHLVRRWRRRRASVRS